MGFWTGYAETPEEREWAERRDYEDYMAQRDAEDATQKDRRIAELEAALRLVDEDVRHHLRSDEITHAIIRKHAVQAVRDALKSR